MSLYLCLSRILLGRIPKRMLLKEGGSKKIIYEGGSGWSWPYRADCL